MTATLIKGTEIREQILEEITAEVADIKEKHGVVPGLVTILVGENPASISYVTLKIKTAHRVGFHEVNTPGMARKHHRAGIRGTEQVPRVVAFERVPGTRVSEVYLHRGRLLLPRAPLFGERRLLLCRPVRAVPAIYGRTTRFLGGGRSVCRHG